MILQLTIDGVLVDIDQGVNISVTQSISDIQEPGNSSAGYTKSVELKFTPTNMDVFGFTNDIYIKDKFNNALHTAEYIVDGNIVMSGVAQIDKVTCLYSIGKKLIGGSFHISIIGSAYEWIMNAKKPLNQLESDESVVYTEEDVYASSTTDDGALVKFFPVDRGAFWVENEDDEMIPRTILDIRDYHPFFNVWKTIKLIFSGWKLRTSLQSLLAKLYCSGYMPTNEDLSYIKDDNDFFIGTSAGSTDEGGEILIWVMSYGNKSKNVYNLYNVWDSYDHKYHNDNGVISYLYIESDAIVAFTPKDDLTVRIETNVGYVTEIANGSTTGSYNDLLMDSGECYYADEFRLHFGDRIESVTFTLDKCVEGAVEYREGGFDVDEYVTIRHDAEEEVGQRKFIIYMKSRVSSTGTNSNYKVKSFQGGAERQNLGGLKVGDNWFVVNVEKDMGDVSIYWAPFENPVSKFIIDDWYYFEIFENRVSFIFNDVIRNAHFLKKGEPIPLYGEFTCSREYGFDPASFPGVKIWITNNNSVKPDFTNMIGIGDNVSIATIGGTNTQLDLLSALRNMFNLMFYTNSITRDVFIEPRKNFYNLDRLNIIDWSDRVDWSNGIEIQELGDDIGSSIRLAYADGGDVIKYYNRKYRTEIGSYKKDLLNKTKSEQKEVKNTIFSPFLTRNVASIGMVIPQDKREKEEGLIDDAEIDLSAPIIGYFAGVSDRTAGDDVEEFPKYPQLVFQDTTKGINLGFEDIQGADVVPGLNKYYQGNISAYNHGRRITLYLKLDPQDIDGIQFPNSGMRDFRAVYMLNVDGDDVLCHLESIVDYNPGNGGSTKCTFIIDPNIKLTGTGLTVITYDDTAVGRSNTFLGYQ